MSGRRKDIMPYRMRNVMAQAIVTAFESGEEGRTLLTRNVELNGAAVARLK